MGNCYNLVNKDEDIISNSNKPEQSKKQSKISANDMIINQEIYVNNKNKNSNINIFSELSNDINYISKTKLKLTIKQSKKLKEGKEYIINSLGLLINNENKTKDGLTIFGDINVIKYIFILFYLNYIKIIQSKTRADFIFPEEESNTKQNHAEIRYDKTLDLYQIRSLRGNGCFLKIEQKIVSNYIITLFSY